MSVVAARGSTLKADPTRGNDSNQLVGKSGPHGVELRLEYDVTSPKNPAFRIMVTGLKGRPREVHREGMHVWVPDKCTLTFYHNTYCKNKSHGTRLLKLRIRPDTLVPPSEEVGADVQAQMQVPTEMQG